MSDENPQDQAAEEATPIEEAIPMNELDELALFPKIKGDTIISRNGHVESLPGCDVFAKFDDSKNQVIVMARLPGSVSEMVQITFKKS